MARTAAEEAELQALLAKAGAVQKGASGDWQAAPETGPHQFDAAQMVMNIPGSAAQFARDAVQPILHPVETARGLYNLGAGIVAKMIPGKQQQEVYADAMGTMLYERYGTLDNFKRTLERDPVGVLGDVSAVLGIGGASLGRLPGRLGRAARDAQRAGTIIDPANIAFQAGTSAVARIPGARNLPARMYESAAKFRTGWDSSNTTQAAAERVRNTQTALREGIGLTDAGRGRVARLIEGLSQQVDDIIDNATMAGVRIRTADILQSLRNARRELDVMGDPGTPRALRQFDAAERAFMESIGGTFHRRSGRWYGYQGSLSPSEAQAAKKSIGQRMNWRALPGSGTQERQAAEQAIRRAHRTALEQIDPRVQALNSRLSDLMELQQPQAQSASRAANRNLFSMNSAIGLGVPTMVGSALGMPSVGVALGVGTSVVTDPRVQAQIAITMHRLIQQGTAPNLASRMAPILVMQMMREGGEAAAPEFQAPGPAAVTANRR